LTNKPITAQEAMPSGWASPSEALKQSLSVHEEVSLVSHVFRNALSGVVLGTHRGSPLASVEAMAEAAGVNLVFYDIAGRNENETSLVRIKASKFLKNAHPKTQFRSQTNPDYPPPGWRRFYKEFHGLIKRTALHKFVPQTKNAEDDAAIRACAAVLQWQAFEIRMEYIEKELTNGSKFENFKLLENGEPSEPVRARDYEGCLHSIRHHLSRKDKDGRLKKQRSTGGRSREAWKELLEAVVDEAEKYGIIEAVAERVHKDGMQTYFA